MRRAIGVTLLLLSLASCSTISSITGGAPDARVPDDDERKLFLTMVREIYRHDRAQAALAFLADYERRFPDDPEARMLRGDALLKTGDQANALKVYFMLREDGYVPMADFGLGKAYAAQSDWGEAAAHFSKAAALAPSNPRYLNNLGYALLQLDRPQEAYAPLARAYDLDRKNLAMRNNYLLAAHRSLRRREVERVIASLDQSQRATIREMIETWQPEAKR